MKKIINYLFPKKSQWFDVGCYERDGHYKLIQMRFNLDNNRKEFRTANMGFINDYKIKNELFDVILSINKN